MSVESGFRTKKAEDTTEFTSVAVIPDLKVVRKKEGTKLEGKEGVALGMFQLYRKGEVTFLPVEFKAIPLAWFPYSIVWNLEGNFTPGQPAALISIADENRSIRYNPDKKEYEQGPLVYGDESQGIPPCEPFKEHGSPGLLLFVLLEDERIGRIQLRYKEETDFQNTVKSLEPFSPVLIKSKKTKDKKGANRYNVDIEPTKGFPEIDVKSYVEKVKAEVQSQVDLQNGIKSKEE